MFQDSKGFIWIGTEDGLNKFDGYEFKIFKNDVADNSTISDNWIRDIIEDDFGRIWVATKKGVNVFDKGSQKVIKFFSNNDFTKKNIDSEYFEIMRLHSDSKSNVWFGLWGGGLIKCNPFDFSYTDYPFDESFNIPFRILNIFEDNNNKLWIGTWDEGLFNFEEGKGYFNSFKKENGLAGNRIREIFQDQENRIWIGTTEGVSIIENGEVSRNLLIDSKGAEGLRPNDITAINEDFEGNIWIGTRNGLNKLEKENFNISNFKNRPNQKNSISGNDIRTLLVDNSGVIWIGTISQGVCKLVKKQFSYLKKKQGGSKSISSNIIYSLCHSNDNTLLLGTKNGLNEIEFFEDSLNINNYYHNESKQSISTNWIWAIKKDYNGYLWLGTHDSGIEKFDPYKKQVVERFKYIENNSNSLSHNFIRSLLFSRDSLLYIGTDGGGLSVLNINTKVFSNFKHENDNPNSLVYNRIWSLMEDKNGNIWIGTDGGGISIFDPDSKHFTNLTTEEKKISSNSIWSLMEDKEGNVWVGTTNNGLDKLDNELNRERNYNVKNSSLPNNTISGLLEDENGNIWICTNNGLAKLNPKSSDILAFDFLVEGAESNEITFGAQYIDQKSNKVFLGGIDGLIFFDPNDLSSNKPIPPNVIINKFNLFDKETDVEWGNRDTIITLSYSDYFFSLGFTALDYTASEKNQYQYKLEGVDPDWRETLSSNRIASYTYVPNGKYVFKVRGANKDGIWNETPTELELIITPPFWKKRSFIITVSILSLLLIYYLYNRRITKLQKERDREVEINRRLIDGRESERIRLAQEIHDGPIQDIYSLNHKIQLEELSQSQNRKVNLEYDLTEIAESLRKVCSNLRPPTIENFKIQKTIKSTINQIREDFPDLNFELDITKKDLNLDKNIKLVVFRIIQESLRNIIKHSKADLVTISLFVKENRAILSIKDDGLGFNMPKDYMFFSKNKHYGILSLFERAKQVNGSIKIESTKDIGTTVQFFFPV